MFAQSIQQSFKHESLNSIKYNYMKKDMLLLIRQCFL